MLIEFLALAGIAMVIAALVRPFRRAAEENPIDEAQFAREEEERIAAIERERK